ncbi:MAG: hypothetical protein HY563_04005 [Ignavibacteriales bacterium]|nr:hypothetical protein [Ignavibacteriales bacterium]
MNQKTWSILGLLVVVSLVLETTLTYESDHWWDSIPAFYSLFGFIGCTAIILISKWLGKVLLQRREDYYD